MQSILRKPQYNPPVQGRSFKKKRAVKDMRGNQDNVAGSQFKLFIAGLILDLAVSSINKKI